MTKLSVNVNKLATLRNSRGGNQPDVLELARKILSYGAFGITVHPRPDERHIRKSDLAPLSQLVRAWNSQHGLKCEFNVEGYPSADYLDWLKEYRPDQATLVPDPPEALTSNAGWNLSSNEKFLSETVQAIRALGIRVSLFIDPHEFSPTEVSALQRISPDRIELYTEEYARTYATQNPNLIARSTQIYAQASSVSSQMGIGVNAGHDLSQANLRHLISSVPQINEVSIGHALICEALEQGLQTTVTNYLSLLKST